MLCRMSGSAFGNIGNGFSATLPADDFFLNRVVQMVTRLRDHVERLDAGRMHAADDIAVVLRALVYKGAGNDILRKLRDRAGHEPAGFLVSRSPNSSVDTFSVGSIPVAELGAQQDGATTATLDDWNGLPVLRIRGDEGPVDWSWGYFLNVYANKWGGAHIDPRVPSELVAIDAYACGGLSLATYLLRAGAVTAWTLAQEMLNHHPDMRALLPPGAMAGISTPGGIGEPPADRAEYGELQWLDHDSSTGIDFLWYVDGTRQSAFRLLAGGLPYDVNFTPTNATANEPPPTIAAPREPVPVTVTSSTGLRQMPTRGRIVSFQQLRARRTPTSA